MAIDHLSSSQLRLYLQCPLKYRFQYIDLLPRVFRSSALVFGSALHSAISWYHKSHLAGVKVSAEKLWQIFDSDFFSQTVESDIRYREGDDEMKHQVMGREMLSLYLTEAKPQEAKGSEVHFTVPLVSPEDGKALGVNLEGIFDLVERDDTVVEFKTSAQMLNPFDVQSLLQLTAYGYAFMRLYGHPPRAFKVVNFVKNKKPKIEVLETTREKPDYDVFLSIAWQILRSIQQGIFYPRTGFWCKECEYRAVCPVWHESEYAV